MSHNPDFSELAARWPSPYVSRDQVGRFSGGILNPRSMANKDSLGVGPKGRVRFGRKVAYPVAELVRWLEAGSVQVPDK